MKNYYEILGITDEEKNLPKNEFEKILKKKYRSNALKFHPDRWANGTDEEKQEAEQKFKEIAEANEVLSDPNKRKMYDNGGFEFDSSGFDPFEMFRNMSGGGFGSMFDMFNNMGGGGRRVNRGSNIQTNLSMSMKEAYLGGEKTISVTKQKPCVHCNGTGSEDGKESTCSTCNGTGRVSKTTQMGPGSFQMIQSICPNCNGTGKKIKNKCKKCNGTGLETETVFETINIPRGLSDGMVVTIMGAGNASPNGGPNGDLLVNIHIKPDNYFVRPDEINIIHYEEVPFNECLLGFNKVFFAIDGTEVTVNAPELTPHGKSFIFKGKGMPHPQNPNIVGDYAVVINHKLPKKLTNEQKKKLKDF